jgi:acyl dehydratase
MDGGRLVRPCGRIAAIADECHGGESRASGGCRDGESLMTPVRIGERFAKTVTFDEEGARAFATLVGDFNPAHHDETSVTARRFGGLIISGTQSTAMMMAMTASFLAEKGQVLGLDFSFSFKKAVRMGETGEMAWVVTAVTPKPRLGDIVEMEGQLVIQTTGAVAVTGKGSGVLLYEP